MEDTKINGSKSPTSEDPENPSKRQKIDTSNSPNPSISGNDSIAPTARGSESTKRRFESILKELEELDAVERSLKAESKQLRTQVQGNAEKIARLEEEIERFKRDEEDATAKLQEGLERSKKDEEDEIARLRGTLENTMRDIEEARKSQTSREFTIHQLKTILEQQISPLMMNSSSEDTLTESQVQEKGQGSILEALLKKPLSNDSVSQDKSTSQDIQLPKTSIAIQTTPPEIPTDREGKALEAKAKRADALEEELQIARATILSLHEAESERRSRMQERIDEAEKLQQQMKIMEKKLEILSSRIGEDELTHDSSGGGDVEMADVSGGDLPLAPPEHSSTLLDQFRNEVQGASSESSEEESSSSDDEPDVDEESSAIQEHEEQRPDGPQMWIGRKYSVLVSSSKFFEIDWNDEYTWVEEKKWACKRCSCFYTSKDQIKDHVWAVHYGGKFQCPHCTLVPKCYKSRATTIQHIRKVHTRPDQGHEEAQDESEEESSPSDDESNVDEVSSVVQEQEPQDNDQELQEDDKYSVSVDPRFFAINWDEEHTREGKNKLKCSKCSWEVSALDVLKDHVWTIHYHGIYQCPHCTNSKDYACKNSVRRHIKKAHIEL